MLATWTEARTCSSSRNATSCTTLEASSPSIFLTVVVFGCSFIRPVAISLISPPSAPPAPPPPSELALCHLAGRCAPKRPTNLIGQFIGCGARPEKLDLRAGVRTLVGTARMSTSEYRKNRIFSVVMSAALLAA